MVIAIFSSLTALRLSLPAQATQRNASASMAQPDMPMRMIRTIISISLILSSGDITLAGVGLDAAQQATHVAALGSGTNLGVRSREFRLTVRLLRQPDPLTSARNEVILDSESFRNLSMDPRHSRYVQIVIGDINGQPRLSESCPTRASAPRAMERCLLFPSGKWVWTFVIRRRLTYSGIGNRSEGVRPNISTERRVIRQHARLGRP